MLRLLALGGRRSKKAAKAVKKGTFSGVISGMSS
jgi:hypothetical protein